MEIRQLDQDGRGNIDIPYTGDTIFLPVMVMILSAAGIVLLCRRKRK